MDGTDPPSTAREEAGDTPLHVACDSATVEAVRELLAQGADPCAINTRRESPLSVAIRRKDAALIRLLVDHGALGANRKVACPFLVHLPETGDLELFAYVLSKGGGALDIADHDAEGRSAFHYALYMGHERMLFLIISSGFDLNPLFICSAKRKDWFYVKGCIDHGGGLIDINAADEAGNTALHHAVLNRDARMVGLLVGAGADLTRVNGDGSTPAMLAADPATQVALAPPASNGKS